MALPHIFGTVVGGSQVPGSWLDDNFNAIAVLSVIPNTATGTNAIALTPLAGTPVISAYNNYQLFSFVALNTSTGAVTAAYSGLGPLSVYLANGTTQANAGDIVAGVFYIIAFNQALNGGTGGFEIVAPVVQAVTGYAAFVSTKTGDYTILPADRGAELRMNSAAAHIFSLPSGVAAGNGFNVQILNINTGVVAITANGTDKILSGGVQLTTIHLPSASDGGTLVCDGGAPAIWSWKGKRSFTGADFVTTISTVTGPLPHSLDVVPGDMRIRLVNTIANQGYSPGDIVDFDAVTTNSGGGVSVFVDNTNYGAATANAATAVVPKGGGAVAAITTADWNFRLTLTQID